MPQVAITDSTWTTASSLTTRSPVTGLTPPLPSVAAITARSAAVARTAHCRKYRSVASSGSQASEPAPRIRYASARLRSPVAASEAWTASSTSSRRPANALRQASTRSNRSAGVAPGTSAVVAMAPALTIAFDGRPLPCSRLIALKASPLGSAPTQRLTSSSPSSASTSAWTNGLDTDWSVNGSPASPAPYRCPSMLTSASPKPARSARASSGMYVATSPSSRVRSRRCTSASTSVTGSSVTRSAHTGHGVTIAKDVSGSAR